MSMEKRFQEDLIKALSVETLKAIIKDCQERFVLPARPEFGECLQLLASDEIFRRSGGRGYRVWIRIEERAPAGTTRNANHWVARDLDGDYRTFGEVKFQGSAQEVVEYLFRKEEIHSAAECFDPYKPGSRCITAYIVQ